MKLKSDVELVLIYTTFPDQRRAEKISQSLVEAKLAACANIFAGMVSIYEWKGEMQRDHEVAVLFKTSPARQKQLLNELTERHPYETPRR